MTTVLPNACLVRAWLTESEKNERRRAREAVLPASEAASSIITWNEFASLTRHELIALTTTLSQRPFELAREPRTTGTILAISETASSALTGDPDERIMFASATTMGIRKSHAVLTILVPESVMKFLMMELVAQRILFVDTSTALDCAL